MIKGIDDLIVYGLPEGFDIAKEITMAVKDPSYKSPFVTSINVSGISESKMKQIFHLETSESFFDHHKEELKKQDKFKYGNTMYKWDEFLQNFAIAQPLLPEEIFFEEQRDSKGKLSFEFLKYNFDNFLYNHKIGKIELGSDRNRVHSIIMADPVKKTLKITTPEDIRAYTIELLTEHNYIAQYNYLHRTDYLGDKKLNSYYRKLDSVKLLQNQRDLQYLYFENKFWVITPAAIKAELPMDIPGYIWEKMAIPHSPELLPEKFVDLQYNKETKEAIINGFPNKNWRKNQFLQYLIDTSNFSGYAKGDVSILDAENLPKTWTDRSDFYNHQVKTDQHLANKLSAIGYMLHNFNDPAVRKSIIAIDSTREEQEEGESLGRSGKSLLGEALKIVTNVFTIDGKKHNLEEDKYLLSGVDLSTAILFFDDLHRYFNFEWLLSKITTGMEIRKMHKDAIQIPREYLPKIFCTTNHAIKGSRNNGSFIDRIHYIVYSDYYNHEFHPIDKFGNLFFYDWDTDQFNMFFSLMAECIQIYLKHGLIPAPSEDVDKKNTLYEAGPVLEWFKEYFMLGTGDKRKLYCPGDEKGDKRLRRTDMMADYLKANEHQKKSTTNRSFKKSLKAAIDHMNCILNPGFPQNANGAPDGGRYSTDGIEYFLIGLREDWSTEARQQADNPMTDTTNIFE